MNHTPENIEVLAEGKVFVFGSNAQGNHAGGAARTAVEKFGAIMGQGEGLQGQSYAIPTMEGLDALKAAVARFLDFARSNGETVFFVTAIGTGIAGHQVEDIAPLFYDRPENVIVPQSFDMERTVTTQLELDRAIAQGVLCVKINSPHGVWLTVTANEQSRVEAWGSSSVEAWGSSSVVARESSSVVAWGSSSVEAWGSSSVVAWGSSSVEAWESSSVEAWESSSVVAWESSSVEAWGSSSVVASMASTVQAFQSAKVKAAPLVAVMLHSATVDVQGGVIIDHTKISDMDGPAWCVYHNVEVKNGIATLFKAVNDKWTTDRGTDYSPGSLPSCDDFKNTNECGYGLHVSPSPRCAKVYFTSATKFVAVGVDVLKLRPITGDAPKAKFAKAATPCVEVDIDGNPVVTP